MRHRHAYDRISVYQYARNVKIQTYTYTHSVPPTGGKPPCSACAILLISGIEACLRESWTEDRNRGERETPTGKERESRTDRERERGGGGRERISDGRG